MFYYENDGVDVSKYILLSLSLSLSASDASDRLPPGDDTSPNMQVLSPLLMLNFVGLTDAAQNFTSKLFDAVVGLMPHYEARWWWSNARQTKAPAIRNMFLNYHA
jgi:hypothetical protein